MENLDWDSLFLEIPLVSGGGCYIFGWNQQFCKVAAESSASPLTLLPLAAELKKA